MQEVKDGSGHHPHYYHHLSQRKSTTLNRHSFAKHSFSSSVVSSPSQVHESTCNLSKKVAELVTSKSTSSLAARQPAGNTQRYLLDQIRTDRCILTRPDEDRRRRTIIIERQNDSFGFTLQTYGIHHKKEDEVELLTYVDRVDLLGPAFRAGLREGDVILSINGQDVENADHRSLVQFILSCEKTMRMVVLFEDCVLKVQLHTRFLKLRRDMSLRKQEYERLCFREKQLLSKHVINAVGSSTAGSKSAILSKQVYEESRRESAIFESPPFLHCSTCTRSHDHSSRMPISFNYPLSESLDLSAGATQEAPSDACLQRQEEAGDEKTSSNNNATRSVSLSGRKHY